MKKILVSFLAVLVLTMQITPSFASFGKAKENTASEEVSAKPQTAEAIANPGTEEEDATPNKGISSLSAEQILALTPQNFEELAGKKMSFKEKIALKFVQKNIKRDLKKHGKVDLKDYVADDGSMRFNLGGFALGLLLGLIGVALAHIFSNNKSFRRSSWYGVGALLIILIIVSAAGGN